MYLTLTVKLYSEGFLFLVLLVTSLYKINAMKWIVIVKGFALVS